MTAEIYAQASWEALKNDTSIAKVLSGLTIVLKTHGHSALYKEVLRDLLVHVEKAESQKVAHITVATKGDEKRLASEIKKFIEAQGVEHTVLQVDEKIIGGFIASAKGREMNASYKKSLLKIYQSLTA